MHCFAWPFCFAPHSASLETKMSWTIGNWRHHQNLSTSFLQKSWNAWCFYKTTNIIFLSKWVPPTMRTGRTGSVRIGSASSHRTEAFMGSEWWCLFSFGAVYLKQMQTNAKSVFYENMEQKYNRRVWWHLNEYLYNWEGCRINVEWISIFPNILKATV